MAAFEIASNNVNKLDVQGVMSFKKTKSIPRTTSLPAFVKPFEKCHSTDGIHSSNTSSVVRTTPVVQVPQHNKPSRYREDFIEVGRLGSGGFGIVCKAENKLDGTTYAMKKISFKSRNSASLEKVLREVKALARLDNPNVVRYYQAWLEEECIDPLAHFKTHYLNGKKFASDDGTCQRRSLDGEDDSLSSETDHSGPDKDDAESEFNSPPGEQIWNFHMRDVLSKIGPSKLSQSPSEVPDFSVQFERDLLEEASSDSSLAEETPFDMDPLDSLMDMSMSMSNIANNADWNSLRKKIQSSYQPKKSIILYIQMQLCEDTLQGWMEARSSIDRNACISIFRQLCKGLQYVHSENIIHRDLKPSNVFLLSKEQIKDSTPHKDTDLTPHSAEGKWVVIGDFGLAVSRQTEAGSPTSSSLTSSTELSSSLTSSYSEHTSGVGTMVYASPEQIQKQSYDEKTDIYSLGIILFELLYLPSTKMERAHVLSNLRKNILPPTFLQDYPQESALILRLLSPDPTDRPSASQLLQHEIFRPRTEMLSITRLNYERMQERLRLQAQQIEQQKRQIEELQRLLAQSQS